MSALVWDAIGEHFFETGIDHGVLYPMNGTTYETGVAWNGLTGVTESPSGAEANAIYADNIKYLNLFSAEEFGATITAYTYPDEWADCNGEAQVGGLTIGQQARKHFGLVYRTIYGNDTAGNDYAYKLHIIYNAAASPSERAYATVNDSPEAIEFSWEISTTPVALTSKDANEKVYKPTSLLVIDSSKFVTTAEKAKLKALEDTLFGTDATTDPVAEGSDPTLPDPDTVIGMLSST